MSCSVDTTFRLRWERFGPEVEASLTAVYGERGPEVTERVRGLVRAALDARPADLRELDERRLLAPDWLQDPRQVGYVAYADRFAGTLAGVGEHLDHLAGLGIASRTASAKAACSSAGRPASWLPRAMVRR